MKAKERQTQISGWGAKVWWKLYIVDCCQGLSFCFMW